ncbi:MAG: hypothetical protein K8R90_06005 [Candidatus Cloacimonetes bacterium]|nr:hypothetical protein [Candidatus Cloacimonadota bacterium]
MKSSLWLKIFAILIALFLWLQHMLLREQTAIIELPLELVQIPDSLTLAQEPTGNVSVIVTARGVDIMLLSTGNARLRLPAENSMQGRNTFPIGMQELVAPDYVQTHEMEIRARHPFSFALDRLERVLKPVELNYASEEDRSWVARQIVSLEPDSIFVQGPASGLAQIENIQTVPLARKPTTDRTIELNLVSPSTLFQLGRENIGVRLSHSEIITRDFNQITIRNPHEDRFAIFPGKVNLLVQGTREALAKLDRADISALLATDAPDSNGEIALRIETPSGYNLISYTPQTVQVIFHEPLPDSGR